MHIISFVGWIVWIHLCPLYHSLAGFVPVISLIDWIAWIHLCPLYHSSAGFVHIISLIDWIVWIYLCPLYHLSAGLLGYIRAYYTAHCMWNIPNWNLLVDEDVVRIARAANPSGRDG